MRVYLCVLSIIFFGCNSSTNKDSQAGESSENVVSNADFMKPQKISFQELPSAITVVGTFNEAWKWTDSLGENIFVLSHEVKKDVQPKEFDEEAESGFIYTAHYLLKEGKYRAIRTSTDDQKSCSFDLLCDFIPGSTTISDLDNNGYAEIKYQFAKACRSDVSPSAMTLVLRENGKSYMLNGTRWVAFEDGMSFNITEDNANLDGNSPLKDELAEMERAMGRYESEYQFSNAPPAFLSFARKEWIKYAKENMGD